MKTLLHYWPMLLSGTALAASDPAGTDPEPRAHETIVVKGQRIVAGETVLAIVGDAPVREGISH